MALRTTKHWFGVVLDAPDAPALAHFYADLLDWTIFDEEAGWATLAPSRNAGYNMAFQTEPNYVRPVWPSRPGEPIMMLHLDLEVDDLEQAVAHAVSVGAEIAQHQPQDAVRVMLDPAGHPFCLYLGSDEGDAEGDGDGDGKVDGEVDGEVDGDGVGDDGVGTDDAAAAST